MIYIFFPNFPDSNQAIVRAYYKNGNKLYEEEYLNGVLHGKSTVWFDDDGSNDDIAEEIYEDGKLIKFKYT